MKFCNLNLLFERSGSSLPNVMRNIEIKAKVRELSQLLRKVKQLSGSNCEIINQHDIFYNTPQGRLKLRKFEDNSAELIFYDRPDGEGPKLSAYDKSTIPPDSVESLNNVLRLALGIRSDVKKKRSLYMVGQTRVHVDHVEGLGDYMELEVVLRPEQSIEEGENIASSLMEKLNINKEDLIAGAYVDLLVKNKDCNN